MVKTCSTIVLVESVFLQDEEDDDSNCPFGEVKERMVFEEN